MASSGASKVPVYSGNDLKTTTDDALVPYLTSLPQPYTFTQNHTKSNVRFVLGFSAVAIAAFTFYADRRLGWEATTSPWIISAVAAYFAINTVFTVWVWGVEAGEVFAGRRKSGETITIRSSVKKYSPLYKIRVVYRDAASKVLQEKEAEAPFTAWFDAKGTLHHEPLRTWLQGQVEILGAAAKHGGQKVEVRVPKAGKE